MIPGVRPKTKKLQIHLQPQLQLKNTPTSRRAMSNSSPGGEAPLAGSNCSKPLREKTPTQLKID